MTSNAIFMSHMQPLEPLLFAFSKVTAMKCLSVRPQVSNELNKLMFCDCNICCYFGDGDFLKYAIRLNFNQQKWEVLGDITFTDFKGQHIKITLFSLSSM